MTEQNLTARLDKLERQNKRLVRAGAAAFGLAIAGWAMSMAPVCKTVWAERFVLRDARNNERAVLTAYETGGTPQLTFLNQKGKSVATLSVDEDGGAFLTLADAKGKTVRFSAHTATQGKGSGGEPEEGSDTVAALSR